MWFKWAWQEKNIRFPQGNGPFACTHMHYLAGILRRQVLLEEAAEFPGIPEGFQKIPILINDLDGKLDAAVKGFYDIMKCIFIHYGI